MDVRHLHWKLRDIATIGTEVVTKLDLVQSFSEVVDMTALPYLVSVGNELTQPAQPLKPLMLRKGISGSANGRPSPLGRCVTIGEVRRLAGLGQSADQIGVRGCLHERVPFLSKEH
jgi:hypothetical protein